MKTKLSPVLLPCPFCGSDEIRMLPQSYGILVDCESCGVQKRSHSRLVLSAICEWNRRPEKLADANDMWDAIQELRDTTGPGILFSEFYDLAIKQGGPV